MNIWIILIWNLLVRVFKLVVVMVCCLRVIMLLDLFLIGVSWVMLDRVLGILWLVLVWIEIFVLVVYIYRF